MSDLKKLAERLRKSLKLEKGAARRLFGRFNAVHQTEDHQGDLERWINDADPDSRASVAQNRVPGEAEKLRQGNKLAAKTKSRRNPMTGEREYLLHRGMHSSEKAAIHDSGAGYSGHSSWTPDYNQAYRFSRDYNGLGTDMGPERKGAPSGLDFHEYVKSAWVPDSKIAFVPNQLHVAGDYSSEHEVVVHPHKPQYAHPDLIKPLKERAHLPGSVPPPPTSLKQRLKGRFGKSLASSLEALQKAVPQGPKMAEFFHDMGAHRRFSTPDAAVAWVREHIRRENGVRADRAATQIDVEKDVLAHLAQVKTPSGWRIIAPHRGVTATVQPVYNTQIGAEWENRAGNQRFKNKEDAIDWVERESMRPGMMRPADVFHHVKFMQTPKGQWRVVRGNHPGAEASTHPSENTQTPPRAPDNGVRLKEHTPTEPDSEAWTPDPTPESSGGSSDQESGREWTPDPRLVLGGEHMPPLWQNHHADLIEGLRPDVDTSSGRDGSLTPALRIAGHSKMPIEAVVKPPLSLREYKMVESKVKQGHQHFLDPNFTSSHREAVYHRMADSFFGLGEYVPRTTVFTHPNTNEVHSAQEFLPGSRSFARVMDEHYGDGQEKEWLEDHTGKHDIERLTIMNAIMGNQDRHSGNVLVDRENKLKMIDHGLTMDYGWTRGPLGNNDQPAYARYHMQEALEPETHKWLDSLKPTKFKRHLAESGVPANLAAVAINRLSEVKNWSKHERGAMKAGEQDHSGKLRTAFDVSKIHRLTEEGTLKPKVEVDEERKNYYAKTNKLKTKKSPQ